MSDITKRAISASLKKLLLKRRQIFFWPLFRSCLHAIKVICRLPFKALPHLKALRTEIKFLSAKVAHITANAMISAPLSCHAGSKNIPVKIQNLFLPAARNFPWTYRRIKWLSTAAPVCWTNVKCSTASNVLWTKTYLSPITVSLSPISTVF